MKEIPTVEYLNQCFEVDFQSGTVKWRLRPVTHFATMKGWRIHTKKCCGKIASVVEKKGYVVLRLNGRWLKAHRVLFKMYHGFEPPQIDHFNRNRLDNSISNLVPADFYTNSRNHKKRCRDLPTGVYRQTSHGGRFLSGWRSLDGRDCTKSFSISEYGEAEAFRLACEYRAKMIAELNEAGAGYTEAHGK